MRKPVKTQQYTVILPSALARKMHLLAERRGMKASMLFRSWLLAECAVEFGGDAA